MSSLAIRFVGRGQSIRLSQHLKFLDQQLQARNTLAVSAHFRLGHAGHLCPRLKITRRNHGRVRIYKSGERTQSAYSNLGFGRGLEHLPRFTQFLTLKSQFFALHPQGADYTGERQTGEKCIQRSERVAELTYLLPTREIGAEPRQQVWIGETGRNDGREEHWNYPYRKSRNIVLFFHGANHTASVQVI